MKDLNVKMNSRGGWKTAAIVLVGVVLLYLTYALVTALMLFYRKKGVKDMGGGFGETFTAVLKSPRLAPKNLAERCNCAGQARIVPSAPPVR